MRTRELSPGLEVGAIGLGCMGMSFAYSRSRRDDAESIRVINRAIDLGATLIDTADVYGPHTNEELVGRAIRGRRDELVLASKCGLVVRDGEIVPEGRPEQLRAAAEGSLRRLGVDRIDLYQLHRVDPQVPVEESWGVLVELVAEGKVGSIGLSEVTVEQLDAAHRIHPVATVQSELSLWSQDQLDEIVPWCRANGAGFIAYSPLGRAFLTGAITAARQLESDDWRLGNPRFQPAAIEANQKLADGVADVAARYGSTASQVALAWVLAQGEQVVPIPGTKRLAYLEENVRASELDLTAEDLGLLGRLGREVVGTRY
ncbi:aldo/keto reductase [Streptacidiphilus sp. P02-A3a]|uniref:aldo/keto reductase n=1 Tax=Streptacidiphilus sp. P02-A3a TaxID=2704468 RepID=UPI0015F7AF2F|nr:aldo/keto reductase [Streptacidiphilus sp. P02-A3a]QMU67030.1 aldo/keto reductase [Streptacidiphilus sp. P02-A3a]